MKRVLSTPEKHDLLAQLHDFMREEGIPFPPAAAVRPAPSPVSPPAAVAGTYSEAIPCPPT